MTKRLAGVGIHSPSTRGSSAQVQRDGQTPDTGGGDAAGRAPLRGGAPLWDSGACFVPLEAGVMPAATPTLVAVEITDADHERGVMSALPSITDLRETSGQVRKVPIGDIGLPVRSPRRQRPAALAG